MAANNDEVFVYMGGNMFVPQEVVRARVHSSVTVLSSFRDCELEEVELNLGLQEIGGCAFWGCHKLKHIAIPQLSTVLADRLLRRQDYSQLSSPMG